MRIEYFSQKFGAILRDNGYDRVVSGFRSGHLDEGALYKVATNSDRVFTRKAERKNKKYNIGLIVDQSGSMHSYPPNSKIANYPRSYDLQQWYKKNPADMYHPTAHNLIECAAETVATLIQGLEKNNLQFSVMGFSDNYEMFKDFNQKFEVEPYQIRNALILHCLQYGSDTNLHIAIKQMLKLFSPLDSEDINITFIMTDGAPYDTEDLEGLISRLEKVSTVVGVGIYTKGVEDYFKHHIVIQDQEEFMTKTLKVLSKLITKG